MTRFSDIFSECPKCGGRERFTGRAYECDGEPRVVLRCPTCRHEYTIGAGGRFEASQVEAYLEVRRDLRDPQRYDLAWTLLRDRDPGFVRAAVLAMYDGAIREAPFLELEEVRLPPDEPDILRAWTELALEYPGFRPEPSAAQRVEEALAAALHFDLPEAAEAAAAHLEDLDAPALGEVLDRLKVRMGGARSGDALVPFFRAVVASGDDSADLLERKRAGWAIPELREAARQAAGPGPQRGGSP